MASDPELVLRSFGTSSETTYLVFHMLQLFVSLENGETREPYLISEEQPFALCAFPDRLPKPIRNFILWQRNILKLDDQELLEIELPRGMKTAYTAKAVFLRDVDEAEDREKNIRAYLEEAEDYFVHFNAVLGVTEATKEFFISIEDTLLRSENLDPELRLILKDSRVSIEMIREKITDLSAVLEHSILPNTIKFKAVQEDAMSLMTMLSEIHVIMLDKIRKYNLDQDGEE